MDVRELMLALQAGLDSGAWDERTPVVWPDHDAGLFILLKELIVKRAGEKMYPNAYSQEQDKRHAAVDVLALE